MACRGVPRVLLALLLALFLAPVFGCGGGGGGGLPTSAEIWVTNSDMRRPGGKLFPVGYNCVGNDPNDLALVGLTLWLRTDIDPDTYGPPIHLDASATPGQTVYAGEVPLPYTHWSYYRVLAHWSDDSVAGGAVCVGGEGDFDPLLITTDKVYITLIPP